MQERMIFAGYGGQGLMMLGKIVALSAMKEGRNVTWFPSYGAEVRGGTAHCHVVITDMEIYSPLVETATVLLIMNGPSLKRFSPRLADGGAMVLNTSLAEAPDDLNGDIASVPATDIANELGNIRVANIVMLGALNAVRPIVDDATVEKALREFLKAKEDLIDVNLAAYARGREAVG